MVAVGSQPRCLQIESMGFVQCYQFESTIGEEVQGKHRVPCPPCRNLRFPAPHSPGAANRAAAEIACRLHLPPAAAARNSHGTLQTKAESVIVGYALSGKCVTHYVSSGFQLFSTALRSIFSYSRFTFAGAVMRTLPSKPKTQPKKGLLAVRRTF